MPSYLGLHVKITAKHCGNTLFSYHTIDGDTRHLKKFKDSNSPIDYYAICRIYSSIYFSTYPLIMKV